MSRRMQSGSIVASPLAAADTATESRSDSIRRNRNSGHWRESRRGDEHKTEEKSPGMRSGLGPRIIWITLPADRRVQDVGHEALKLRRHERLRDETDAAGAAERVRLISGSYSESDDRNWVRYRISLQALQNLQSLHSGQVVVEEYQIRDDRLQHSQPGFATPGEEDSIASVPKQFSGDFVPSKSGDPALSSPGFDARGPRQVLGPQWLVHAV
jgi:hypothetical protein